MTGVATDHSVGDESAEPCPHGILMWDAASS